MLALASGRSLRSIPAQDFGYLVAGRAIFWNERFGSERDFLRLLHRLSSCIHDAVFSNSANRLRASGVMNHGPLLQHGPAGALFQLKGTSIQCIAGFKGL